MYYTLHVVYIACIIHAMYFKFSSIPASKKLIGIAQKFVNKNEK